MTDPSTAHGHLTWTTAVTALEPELMYRGYRVETLAESASFLESAYLVLTGELPTNEQWADWQALLLGGMTLPDHLVAWLGRVPATARPADVLRAALGRLRLQRERPEVLEMAELSDALPQWLGLLTALYTARVRLQRGLEPLAPRDDLGFAANLWWLLHGKDPAPEVERALDTVLITGLDHGVSPATAAVRLAAATGVPFCDALECGLGLMTAPRPTGEAAAALELLASRSPDRAVAQVKQLIARDKPIPGFEHRVYRVGDPRAEWLTPICQAVARSLGRDERERVASAIEQAVWDGRQRLPSVLWPAARLMDYLGFDGDQFAPLYVISRLAGWAAHYAEQQSTAAQIVGQYRGVAPRSFSSHQERT